MTAQEMVIEVYENLGQPTDSKMNIYDDAGNIDENSAGFSRILSWINRGMNRIMNYRYPDGKLLRFNNMQKYYNFTLGQNIHFKRFYKDYYSEYFGSPEIIADEVVPYARCFLRIWSISQDQVVFIFYPTDNNDYKDFIDPSTPPYTTYESWTFSRGFPIGEELGYKFQFGPANYGDNSIQFSKMKEILTYFFEDSMLTYTVTNNVFFDTAPNNEEKKTTESVILGECIHCYADSAYLPIMVFNLKTPSSVIYKGETQSNGSIEEVDNFSFLDHRKTIIRFNKAFSLDEPMLEKIKNNINMQDEFMRLFYSVTYSMLFTYVPIIKTWKILKGTSSETVDGLSRTIVDFKKIKIQSILEIRNQTTGSKLSKAIPGTFKKPFLTDIGSPTKYINIDGGILFDKYVEVEDVEWSVSNADSPSSHYGYYGYGDSSGLYLSVKTPKDVFVMLVNIDPGSMSMDYPDEQSLLPSIFDEGLIMYATWLGLKRGQENNNAYSLKRDFEDFMFTVRGQTDNDYDYEETHVEYREK